MNFTRSKLLVALVLIGVSGVGMIDASATTVKLVESPPSGPIVTNVFLQPQATPDAGEPDLPNAPPRTGASRDRGGEPSLGSGVGTVRSLAETLRLTWVIWMARYLNQGH